jgi:hypothetical protein
MSDVETNAARKSSGLRAIAYGLGVNPDLLVAQKVIRDAADKIEELERERDEAIRQRNETNESSKYAVDYAIRERDEAREIAGRLAHFLERPAYSVDEAIARMEALNSYKKQTATKRPKRHKRARKAKPVPSDWLTRINDKLTTI